MKRWLIGSLACNLLLIGIGAGFLVGGFLRPGPLPPLGPRPGIQRDLMIAAETGLTGKDREQAMEVIRRNSDDFAKPPLPRADELLARFVAGDVPKLQDFLDPGFEQRRRRDAENLRKIFAELADVLEEPEQRQALVDALQKRIDAVRACIDAGAVPPR